ncbi:Mth938-like domain-containing protein [Infirmifilum sp. SLHALR2]|nr:MAG: hypothetical protein B7L53_06135 [Thermofilum sp. NZ13]
MRAEFRGRSPVIEDYSFGRIKVLGKVYHRDIILGNDGVIVENWWRREGHLLSLEDIQGTLEQYKPNVLVVGAGSAGALKVHRSVLDYCAKNGIRVIVEKTGKAVETFNELVSKGERVVGAFHLTC